MYRTCVYIDAVQGPKKSKIYLVSGHGFPDVRKYETLHVLKLVLHVCGRIRNK